MGYIDILLCMQPNSENPLRTCLILLETLYYWIIKKSQKIFGLTTVQKCIFYGNSISVKNSLSEIPI